MWNGCVEWLVEWLCGMAGLNGWVEWLGGMAVLNGWVFRRETASGFCPFGDASASHLSLSLWHFRFQAEA